MPFEKKEQLEGLLAVLERCRKYYKHMIFTGDLNSKSLAWNIKNQMYVETCLKIINIGLV